MPDPSIIAAGIQAGGNAVNGLIDVAYREATYSRNKRDIIEAEQRQNEEWQRRFNAENAFNHPSLQAQRLKEAGINPIQALSGSSPTPSASGSTNDVNTPQGQPFESGFGSGIAEIYLAGQRVENETKVADAQAELFKAEAAKTRTDESMSYWEQEFARRRDERDERVVKMQEEMHTFDKRMASVAAEIAEATKENEIAMSDASLEELEANIEYLVKRGKLTDQQILDYYSIWAERSVQTELMQSQITLNAQEASMFYHKLANMDADTLVKLSQGKLNEEEAKKAIAEAKQIEAYTKEIPANAKEERRSMRWKRVTDTVNSIGSSAGGIARAAAAIGTGGVSEILKFDSSTSAYGSYEDSGYSGGYGSIVD